MKIYRKIITESVACESIEISELDEKRFELEELELKELFEKYEIVKKVEPTFCYERDFGQELDYSLSEI
jgi:hypothetical protein